MCSMRCSTGCVAQNAAIGLKGGITPDLIVSANNAIRNWAQDLGMAFKKRSDASP